MDRSLRKPTAVCAGEVTQRSQYYGIAVLTGCMMLSIFMVSSDIFLLLAQIQSESFCFPDSV